MSSVFSAPYEDAQLALSPYLLSPLSPSPHSPIFEVARGETVLVRAFNMGANQIAVIEMVSGNGAGQLVAPAVVNGVPLALTSEHNMQAISTIGRYRVVVYADGLPVELGETMPTVELLR